MEDQRTGNQVFRWSPRIIGWIQCAFSNRDVAGRIDEARKLFVDDDVPIHPEAIDSDFVDRAFLGIEIVRTHEKRPTRNPQHIQRRLSLRKLLKHLVGHPSPRMHVINTTTFKLPLLPHQPSSCVD